MVASVDSRVGAEEDVLAATCGAGRDGRAGRDAGVGLLVTRAGAAGLGAGATGASGATGAGASAGGVALGNTPSDCSTAGVLGAAASTV